MMTAIRFPSRRLAASLSLAFIAIAASRITAFEIPFPQTGAQIRSSIVSSDVLATSSPSLPVPITQTVKLSSGTSAEIITCRPKVLSPNFLESIFRTDGNKSNKKPVLAFLHGSFHASWCWAEHYMPFFAERGYECVSLSLQGTGGTPGEYSSYIMRNLML
jgi:pimeloyl-ACP methyl ester carboxylesterase